MVPVALASVAGSIPVDLDLSNHFTLTLTEDSTLEYPSNIAPGQEGVIEVNNGTPGRTLTFDVGYVFDNNVAPVLSPVDNTDAMLGYYVRANGTVFVTVISSNIS